MIKDSIYRIENTFKVSEYDKRVVEKLSKFSSQYDIGIACRGEDVFVEHHIKDINAQILVYLSSVIGCSLIIDIIRKDSDIFEITYSKSNNTFKLYPLYRTDCISEKFYFLGYDIVDNRVTRKKVYIPGKNKTIQFDITNNALHTYEMFYLKGLKCYTRDDGQFYFMYSYNNFTDIYL